MTRVGSGFSMKTKNVRLCYSIDFLLTLSLLVDK